MIKGGLPMVRKRFRLAFEKSLGQRVGRIGTSLLWRNCDGHPQVLEMFGYQDGYRFNVSPIFFRAAINFRPPSASLIGFWSEKDQIDPRAPNANIEITVMLEEAESLAAWLPYWLQCREGVRCGLPAPPAGMRGLLEWEPKQEHVYYWSEKADKSYLSWKEGYTCPKA